MTIKHANWADLRAAVKTEGLKDVFVTAVGAKKNRFTISVVTKRVREPVLLATRRDGTKARTFVNVAAAVRVSRRLTRCKVVLVVLEPPGKND